MSQPGDWIEERHRKLLKLYLRQYQLDPRLRQRFDASDLVQDAFAKAVAKASQFVGQSEGERVQWLREILTNVVIDRIRYECAERRDVAKEQPLVNAVQESSVRLDNILPGKNPSPSEQAQGRELLFRFAEAVDELSDDQRDVVIMRHRESLTVAEIAEQLGKTPKAVAALLYRGEHRLRVLLSDDKPGP